MSQASYQQLINSAAVVLNERSNSPRIDAEVLMQMVVQKPLAWLIAHGQQIASAEHTKHFFTAVEKRQNGKPIAYITGHKEFWSLNLKINEHVLVPRPDTETLVEVALNRIRLDQPLNILDLGTGSGAIALAIAKERPNVQVCAVDVCKNALNLAQQNSESNQVSNVTFKLSNWFDSLQNDRYEVIVSNPPYVAATDPHLKLGDLPAEPVLALVGKDDGLGDIRHIIAQAKLVARTPTWVIIEHGYDQGDLVRAIFKDNGYAQINTYKDLNNLPRCTEACLP